MQTHGQSVLVAYTPAHQTLICLTPEVATIRAARLLSTRLAAGVGQQSVARKMGKALRSYRLVEAGKRRGSEQWYDAADRAIAECRRDREASGRAIVPPRRGSPAAVAVTPPVASPTLATTPGVTAQVMRLGPLLGAARRAAGLSVEAAALLIGSEPRALELVEAGRIDAPPEFFLAACLALVANGPARS